MYDQGTQSVKREKQPELSEAYQRLQELGNRLEKAVSRIKAVGNKLSDESQNVSEGKPNEPSPYMPGMVSDYNNLIKGYESLIDGLEREARKLENQI